MAENNGALIAPGTQIRGRIQGDAELVVEGVVEGSIALDDTLRVEEGGQIDAEVDAPQIVVRGQLAGEAEASELISLEANSTVTARLKSPRITVDGDARLVANFAMDVELPSDVEIPENLADLV